MPVERTPEPWPSTAPMIAPGDMLYGPDGTLAVVTDARLDDWPTIAEDGGIVRCVVVLTRPATAAEKAARRMAEDDPRRGLTERIRASLARRAA